MDQRGVVFRNEELNTYWRFVYERHSIWHRRFILKLPRERWTQDEILKKIKFTNMYRELDPGTRYAREHILEVAADRRDIVFNMMLYRLMCSIPTYDGYGFQTIEDFDWLDFQTYLGEIYESGRPVFGNAYLISPYSSMGSEYKHVNVARLFGNIRANFLRLNIFKDLDEAKSFEQAFKIINAMYGMGPFLSYQVMVDLTYPLSPPYRQVFPFSQNDWVRLGPGALRGFARVSPSIGGGPSGLKCLRENQREEFARLGLDFPWLLDEDGGEVELTLANLQNTFCEYHKYRSIQDGIGKSQRLFVPRSGGGE